MFFANGGVGDIDQPSWYVVAATETDDPDQWLPYAQDRKAEDLRYSVADFRRDIEEAPLTQSSRDAEALEEGRQSGVELSRLGGLRRLLWLPGLDAGAAISRRRVRR